ncbi:MAG: hypothetical protein IJ785_05275 [Bacteroidales bacterium]|nr:hypothetical protein [Bacteroidales bacterium]
MKKTVLILMALMAAATGWCGGEPPFVIKSESPRVTKNAPPSEMKSLPFWKRITVGAEFVHNITKGYYYGNNSILLDHPHNSVDIRVGCDLNKYCTVALHGGLRMCHRGVEGDNMVETDNYSGSMSRSIYVNEPYLMMGIEAHLHLLPLVGVESPWYDVYAIGRAGYTTQDLGLTVGLGFAFWPWKWGSVFGSVGAGSLGVSTGFRDESWPHFQLRTGVSVRL